MKMIKVRPAKRWAKTSLVLSIILLAVTSCTRLGGQPEPGLWSDPQSTHDSVNQSDPCAHTVTTAHELFEPDGSGPCERLDWTPTHLRGWVTSGWTSSYSQQWTNEKAATTYINYKHRQVVRRTWDWRTGRGTVTGAMDEVRREQRTGPHNGCVLVMEATTDEIHAADTFDTGRTIVEVGGNPLQFSTTTVVVPGTRGSIAYVLDQHPPSPNPHALRCGDSHRKELAAVATDIEDFGQALGPGIVTAETATSVTVSGSNVQTVPYSPAAEGGFTVTYELSWNLTVDKVR